MAACQACQHILHACTCLMMPPGKCNMRMDVSSGMITGMAMGVQEWEEMDVVNEGVWQYLADGTCMWSLSIMSPGAYSHVAVFR